MDFTLTWKHVLRPTLLCDIYRHGGMLVHGVSLCFLVFPSVPDELTRTVVPTGSVAIWNLIPMFLSGG